MHGGLFLSTRLARKLNTHITKHLYITNSYILVTMKTTTIQERAIHSPTLNTVLMVELTIKSADESVLTIAELKRRLPKQVNHSTLMLILEYLEDSNKIAVSLKGITWIHNTNPSLQKAIRGGLEL